ncbi:MAG: aminotransferase class V-fold PLP-dependent enzyme [Chloroflexi bacterium]|nr:aminotransferase class V-fold PLP-dependent enzyme [Chloroflexota bacterium]
MDLAELDDLRATEYARLDDQSHVYLDYTGAGLYATSQLREHSTLLEQALLGNPHSTNPTSNAAAAFAERARASVLEFFNASADEYTVVLTPNATGALKLVGEAYPFEADSRLVLTADNHNSVNGIREFARAAGTPVTYVPLEQADLRVDPAAVDAALQPVAPGKHALFAYPAQSNLSGVQHPLEWIPLARRRGWDVLLDAAASVPTNRLDVDRWQPDFVAVSFYKIFGYPTGIGCLIARRSALARLRRPWFSGGTIDIVSVSLDAHAMRPDEAGFEDGTINFLGLPAVEIGLRYIQAADIDAVHARVQALTEWLLERMAALRHPNGAPVVQLYGPTNMRQRGGTVAFNVLTPDGEVVDYHRVEQAAGEWNISLRGGCFCNPGAAEAALELTPALLRTAFSGSGEQSRHAWGMVRVSLGIATTPADICRLIEFLTAWPGGGGRNRSDG